MGPLRQLLSLTWSAAPRLMLVLAFSQVLAGALPALGAFVSKELIDGVEAAQQGKASTDEPLFWLALEAAAMGVLLLAVRGGLVARRLLALRVAERLRERIIDLATGLPLEEMEQPETHDRIALARRQAPSRPASFLQNTFGVVRGALAVVASASIVVVVMPWALLVVLLAALPSLGSQIRYARALHVLSTEQIAQRRMQGYLENILTREGFAKEVRVFGYGPALRARFTAVSEAIYEAEARTAKRREGWASVWGALATLAVYGALAMIVWRAAEGTMSVGEMTMALIALRQTQRASEGLTTSLSGLARDQLYLGDLALVWEMAESSKVDGPSTAGARSDDDPLSDRSESLSDGLHFVNVSYTYPGVTKAALEDVSFSLRPGQVLGLVGLNGSGKSTLLKVALGLLPPASGQVYLDGRALAAWSKEERQARLTTVFQDFSRYKLTIRDNIWLGDTHQSAASQEEAAARAGVDMIAQDHPDGLETRLGRSFAGGVDLSGGQWQKLAIARGFLRDGSIMIFDEPTAALDPEAEAAFFDELATLRGEHGIVVAAHRLSALRGADEILLLEGGRERERGTHEALMALGGRYAELFEIQAESYREG